MASQCTARIRLNTELLICVLDKGHEGRHQDSEDGTWRGETRDETRSQLFGHNGLMFRGLENRRAAEDADAVVVLYTDGTYEVLKDRHTGIGFKGVTRPTLLYVKHHEVRVVAPGHLTIRGLSRGERGLPR